MPTAQASPSVTVGIPTYNGERFIGQAMESVLSQTFCNFELLVADDDSTDKTLEIVRRYQDQRIRILPPKGRIGFEANWNRCLAEAKGTYLKLLPQDDLLRPTCLEKQVQALEAPGNEGVVLTACSRDIVDPEGVRRLVRRCRFGEGRTPGGQAVRRTIRSGTNLIGEPGAVLFRAETFRAAGPFDGKLPYLIDLDMWARLLAHGDLHTTVESLAAFRVSSGAVSFAVRKVQHREFIAFARGVKKAGVHDLGPTDLVLAHFWSRINAILRQAFYLLWLRRSG